MISYLIAHAPKKVTKGTAFIDKVHEDKIDPNAPLLLAVRKTTVIMHIPRLIHCIQRNEDELKEHKAGFALLFLQNSKSR